MTQAVAKYQRGHKLRRIPDCVLVILTFVPRSPNTFETTLGTPRTLVIYTWNCFRPLQKIKDLPCRLPSRSRFPIWTMLRIIDNPQIQVYICVCVLLEYVHIRSCPNYIDYLFTMFPEFRIIYRCFSPISWSTPQKIHRESLTKIAVITRRTAKTMTLPSRGRSKLYIEISARIVDN